MIKNTLLRAEVWYALAYSEYSCEICPYRCLTLKILSSADNETNSVLGLCACVRMLPCHACACQ